MVNKSESSRMITLYYIKLRHKLRVI